MLEIVLIIGFLLSRSSGVLISSKIQQELDRNGKADVFVDLKSSIQSIFERIELGSYTNYADRTNIVVKMLHQHTQKEQSSLLDFLKHCKEGISELNMEEVIPFWITNKVLIKNASSKLVQAITKRDDVVGIHENTKIMGFDPIFEQNQIVDQENVSSLNEDLTWGLRRIQIEQVWRKGYTGKGIRVGILDSGINSNHEALKNSRADDYSWFDAIDYKLEPVDSGTHGTLVTGIITGSHGIGVAPEAKWMHCRFIKEDGSATFEGIITCAQWIICPTLPNGRKHNCSKAPSVVSNSWGLYVDDLKIFDEILASWNAVGIVPVFAIGNRGPACSTAASPGDSAKPVISVGATNECEELAGFSSRGPSQFGHVVPTVSAPGQRVKSAYGKSNDRYIKQSGTSMAAPHVAGLIAVLQSAKPDLTFDEIKEALEFSSTRTIKTTGSICGGVSETRYPNNHVGYGRISSPTALYYVLSL